MKRTTSLAALAWAFMAVGCAAQFFAVVGGQLSKPAEAHVDFADGALNKFDAESRRTLFRYLAGNLRWEIREERGIRFAVRREKVDGKYATSLNGFYSNADGEPLRQTRVLLCFDKSYGFGREHGNITRVKAGAGDSPVIVEGPHSGTPGNSSYVILEGDGLYLEIYDQAVETERSFTKAAISETCDELTEVLKHRKDIDATGLLPVGSKYRIQGPTEKHFQVNDGMQPGIYLLDAAVSPSSAGHAYVKAFDEKTGARLSAGRITPRSTRYIGWSTDGATVFPYNAEITVYEGDWTAQYRARFKIWHRSENGTETKLAETSRMINGWQQ